MSILTPLPPTIPLLPRLLLQIPVLGWIARDVLFGSKDNIWYALVLIATVWIIAITTWGLVAFVLPVVMLVPFCLLTLVLITLG